MNSNTRVERVVINNKYRVHGNYEGNKKKKEEKRKEIKKNSKRQFKTSSRVTEITDEFNLQIAHRLFLFLNI